MLTRREHAEKELAHKLIARGYPRDEINELMQSLKSEGLQSDSRYTEAYIHSRVAKGYGPVRIQQELKERGIPPEMASACMEDEMFDWQELIAAARQKKFGDRPVKDYNDQAKQSRFLQYRGFTSEQIRELFRNSDP